MQSVIETLDFLADAKAAGVTDEERSKIVSTLARNPQAGVEIPGTGGARKSVSADAARARAADIA
jgi:hypothetical protein